jgi:hypothetical protein
LIDEGEWSTTNSYSLTLKEISLSSHSLGVVVSFVQSGEISSSGIEDREYDAFQDYEFVVLFLFYFIWWGGT